MSRYISLGNLPDELDVAIDMDGLDIRISVEDVEHMGGPPRGNETLVQPDVAVAMAYALLAAARECGRRRAR
jgi:hypothetical protein